MKERLCEECDRPIGAGGNRTHCGVCVQSHVPTPAEIAQRAAECRARWTAKEEARRTVKSNFKKQPAIREVSFQELVAGFY